MAGSGQRTPLTWTEDQQAGIDRRESIRQFLKQNYVSGKTAMEASLNEFRYWTLEQVTALFADFPPLPGRRLYPLGPESRYPPPGNRRWGEFAAKVAMVGAADALALVTSPLTMAVMKKDERKKAVKGLVDLNMQVVTSSLFVAATLEQMEEAGRMNQALCVNRWGQFRIMQSGYAAISHVWSETMGLEYNDEKIQQDERGMLMSHLNKIMERAFRAGYEWVWFDLLAIPKKSDGNSKDPRLSHVKTIVINSLHAVYRNADAVVVLDSFGLHLPSGDPLRLAALIVCGRWLTRIWTFQEIKLAKRAVFVTATHVVDFRDIMAALEHQAGQSEQHWSELYKTFNRLRPIHDQGISLADISLSSTNRSTENEVDYARGYYALLGLQWQTGWTYDDGILNIYRSRPQQASVIASMHSPRGLPSPFSWAPRYLAHNQGRVIWSNEFDHSEYNCNPYGLTGSWYTAVVSELQHVAAYGMPNDNQNDKMAFQLVVRDGRGQSSLVTVVTWGDNWTRDLKTWTELIPSGTAVLLCAKEMAVGEHFSNVLLAQVHSVNAAAFAGSQVASVLASAVFVHGRVEAPVVPWTLQ